MEYNTLYNQVKSIRPARCSALNRQKLLNRALGPGVWEFKGTNGKKYEVVVNYARDWVGVTSKHRLSTLEKWCGESVGHIKELF